MVTVFPWHQKAKDMESNMKEVLDRFPKLGEGIFEQLDDQNLVICKKVHKTWRNNILDQRIYWIRMIRKGTKHCNEFAEEWRKAVEKIPIRILEKLARLVLRCNKDLSKRSISPLHICALYGDLEIFNSIEIKFQDKNPKYVAGEHKGCTPLHFAAVNSHLAICQLIVEKVEDKNPGDNNGITPLHNAAGKGHLAICQLIIEKVKDKNPRSNTGFTPLHNAAYYGHLAICQLIVEKVVDKNPRSNNGNTPLHVAADRGHLEACKFIAKNATTKNPTNNIGKSPLDLAHKEKHWPIIYYLIGLNNLQGNQ